MSSLSPETSQCHALPRMYRIWWGAATPPPLPPPPLPQHAHTCSETCMCTHTQTHRSVRASVSVCTIRTSDVGSSAARESHHKPGLMVKVWQVNTTHQNQNHTWTHTSPVCVARNWNRSNQILIWKASSIRSLVFSETFPSPRDAGWMLPTWERTWVTLQQLPTTERKRESKQAGEDETVQLILSSRLHFTQISRQELWLNNTDVVCRNRSCNLPQSKFPRRVATAAVEPCLSYL